MFPGTWQMQYLKAPGHKQIFIELQIATAESNILYPAHLKLQCDNFTGDYELLLVKKTSRELAISRNKYAVSEQPFTLGDWSFLVNGIFDYSKDLKGIPTLTASRIQSQKPAASIPNNKNESSQKNIIEGLKNFLKDGEIALKKIDNIPWEIEKNNRIPNSDTLAVYFGVKDTILLNERDGNITLAGSKKLDNDIVTVSLNGHTILDKIRLDKKKFTDDILLNTGLNILAIFADNFGNTLPNKAKLSVQFGNQKYVLDFTEKEDSAATFIVAKIFNNYDTSKTPRFQNNIANINENKFPKNDKVLGSIIATSSELTLAIWDDATEDGDSISININDKWLVQHYPVKKTPQFIRVTLKPGPNVITFIAENLGAIPPNTSVLEIIEGKKRKSFLMESQLEEKNLIKIFYDIGKK